MSIILYKTNNCSKCEMLKHILTHLKIRFDEINVEENQEARTDLLLRNVLSFPALQINGFLFNNGSIMDNGEINSEVMKLLTKYSRLNKHG